MLISLMLILSMLHSLLQMWMSSLRWCSLSLCQMQQEVELIVWLLTLVQLLSTWYVLFYICSHEVGWQYFCRSQLTLQPGKSGRAPACWLLTLIQVWRVHSYSCRYVLVFSISASPFFELICALFFTGSPTWYLCNPHELARSWRMAGSSERETPARKRHRNE